MKVTKTYLKVPVEIYEHPDPSGYHFMGKIADEDLSGPLSQGKTFEEAEQDLVEAFKTLFEYYRTETHKLRRRAIWNSGPGTLIGNFRKKGQYWFSVFGLHFIINHFDKRPNNNLHTRVLWTNWYVNFTNTWIK